MSILISVFFVLALIFLNALFVAGEFSTVSSKKSKLWQESKNNRFAKAILDIVANPKNLDSYVATCQVGITISSLVLGFYGQTQFSSYLIPIFENRTNFPTSTIESISATTILLFLTVFQVVLGELVPKNIGIQFPEKLAVSTYVPIKWASWIFKPLNYLFNGSGIFLMKLFDLEPSSDHVHIHSLEEIAMLVEESGTGGLLGDEEHELLKKSFEISNTLVKDVMVPRTKMLTASIKSKPKDVLRKLAKSPYSRVPVYDGSIDNVIGTIHIRDLLCLNYFSSTQQENLQSIIHNIIAVPATVQANDLFKRLQNEQHQVAIILDEFGGTAGMVTIEDLLEQIFGDLQDEFDL